MLSSGEHGRSTMRDLGFFRYMLHAVPGTVWAVGISSLLINTATSASFIGVALYLKITCGVSIGMIGCLEAIVEAIAYITRMFSGAISDYFKRRKPLMILGFAMIIVSKPLLAMSRVYATVLVARGIDRIGNGMQASPRDALISDSAPHNVKGACFGLRQSLAVIGSTLGGIGGIVVMRMSDNSFTTLFTLSTVPALIAVVTLIMFVKEEKKTQERGERRKIRLRDLKLLGKHFWMLMVVVTPFMLSRFSEVFISLHACGNFGLDIAYGTSITVIYNLMSTAVSYPIGKLSDRIGRVRLLLLGFIILLFAHLLIGFAMNLYMVLFGTILWGCQRGIADGLIATMVSDYVPKDLRGTGFGVYYFVVSFTTAISSATAGAVSQLYGEAYAFIMGACCCGVAGATLYASRKFLQITES
ncbi:MAG: MFS transporter [Holosporales bacterium]|jgi:MFS family permease|nr:MFS transporter [Holosporales bacterium]